MANNVNITSKGIKKVLKNYNFSNAFAEYIWNGFDAKANTIEIRYEANELGKVDFIEVSDNGYGINYSRLNQKFKPFYESEKAIEISSPKHTSSMHGKNGVGRLTFFTFAHIAKWLSTYKEKDRFITCSISTSVNELNDFNAELIENNSDKTGTTVTFSDVQISKMDIESTIIPFLKKEFCWFLELNKKNKILINDELLDYSENISDYDDTLVIYYPKSRTKFSIKYIQWKESLNKEFSKYYFLNSEDAEVYKDYTTLNKKADQYFHSVYIKSDFFDNFDFKSSEDENQMKLFGQAKNSQEYKYLINEINEFLRNKRKPFLKIFADRLIENYEESGILPSYENEWEEKYRKHDLIETIKSLYEVQPKLFTNLNKEQKKTFVRLIDLLLDSNERGSLFKILEEVVELETKEREDLAKLFQVTRFNRITETIKLIEDRYKAYYMLKDLVFNKDLKANEVDHLQKFIEKHYWIFGEQYHLVTAAEPKFEEALRRYIYLLTEKDESIEIEHQHRLKEMDIFACRQNKHIDSIDNIVVELKHPSINLGNSQYSQVYNYLDLIQKQQEFNAPNMNWEFYLVGNKFDSTNFIQNQINTNKPHGIKSLIMNLDNGRIKVYAKTWSEIFTDFEIKHSYLNEQLSLEREKLVNELQTANEVIESAGNNLAVQPEEIVLDGNK